MRCWKNAISEEYYSCDVVVNGKKFYSVGIRPGGKYQPFVYCKCPGIQIGTAFKLEFDHYIEGADLLWFRLNWIFE